MNAAQVHDFAPRRMTPDDYRAERERIEQTYGSSSAEAAAHRDQALAALYHRSGWTQDELAKVEGCSQQKIAQRVLFGRFLAFTTSGSNPKNLTERRFRSYWEQTEKNPNERVRFAAVQRLMEDETRIGKSTKPHREVGAAIVDKFADGKWHGVDTIKSHVQAPAEHVDAVLELMRLKKTYGVNCERRQAGKSHQYRIVKGGGQRIDAAVLAHELRPLLDGLYAEGKKNAAHISGAAIQTLTGRIEKLVEQLAK